MRMDCRQCALRVRGVVLVGLICAMLSLCRATVTLPPVLGDHMVLQREMAVPIWGRADPGETVTVKFCGQTKQATADGKGYWQVKLDPLPAGGPFDLTVTAAETITLTDVLVGEVWVAPNGVNIQMLVNDQRLAGEKNLAKLLAGLPYPQLRLGSVTGWREATAQNCQEYSAYLFAFGVLLQQQLGVPVGMLSGASVRFDGYLYGWLSEKVYRSDPEVKVFLEQYRIDHAEMLAKEEADYQAALQRFTIAKANWEKMPDRTFNNMPRPPAKPLLPGESDRPIGVAFEQMIRPLIPFAIRGVLWEYDSNMALRPIKGIDPYTGAGALIRGWRAEWGRGDLPFIYIGKPYGGGCAYDPTNPETMYAEQFTELPPAVVGSIAIRETYLRMMSYPHTGMAISSDLGPGVFPVNKVGYASRAARVALGMVYGKPVEYYGPLFKEQAIERAKIRIRYTHIGQGLAIPAGHAKLQGFTLAGEDKQFVWADAVIDGDTVVVSSEKIAQPRYVRYAWVDKALWANLFNKDGLPAIPFRTDGE